MWCIRNNSLKNVNHLLKKVNIKTYRFLNSNIPENPIGIVTKSTQEKKKIDPTTVSHLERLSLVDFGNEKGIKILEDAVEFADQLSIVNTEGVEPLVTVLENCELRLREDIVTDGNCRKEILSNASVVEEDYFVAPPGNIPVNTKTYSTDDTIIKKESSTSADVDKVQAQSNL